MPCGETADTFVYASTNIFKRSFITLLMQSNLIHVVIRVTATDTTKYYFSYEFVNVWHSESF